MNITPELILSLQSPNGGWSKDSLAKLGVPWPPPQGWRMETEKAVSDSPLRLAYADPPYLGQGKKHYAPYHANAAECDSIDWHAALIKRLSDEYPDGWVLSASSVSLRALLPLCPQDIRVGAWMKTFCSFKPNVNPAYAWEPVIWR